MKRVHAPVGAARSASASALSQPAAPSPRPSATPLPAPEMPRSPAHGSRAVDVIASGPNVSSANVSSANVSSANVSSANVSSPVAALGALAFGGRHAWAMFTRRVLAPPFLRRWVAREEVMPGVLEPKVENFSPGVFASYHAFCLAQRRTPVAQDLAALLEARVVDLEHMDAPSVATLLGQLGEHGVPVVGDVDSARLHAARGDLVEFFPDLADLLYAFRTESRPWTFVLRQNDAAPWFAVQIARVASREITIRVAEPRPAVREEALAVARGLVDLLTSTPIAFEPVLSRARLEQLSSKVYGRGPTPVPLTGDEATP